MSARTLTLTELQTSARSMGLPAYITDTGGGVMAVCLTIDGHHFLMALDWGQEEGSTWSIATDGETREVHGERESDDYPVTSDADQTIRDAIGWWRSSDDD